LSIDTVLHQLKTMGKDPAKNGVGWKSLCPGHDDHNPSLVVNVGDDGKVLLDCKAGCTFGQVQAAIGLPTSEYFPDKPSSSNGDGKPKTKKTWANPRESAEWKAKDEKSPGKVSSLGPWLYRDRDGAEVMRVYRIDLVDGDKMFWPMHPVPGGWQAGDPQGALPLYCLPEVVAAQRVFVFEGEKCCDLARVHLGVAATTAAHGAKSPKKTDWSPLVGKEVFFVPDHDNAGESYVNVAAGILAKLDPKTVAKIIRLPVANRGDDIAEWLDAGHGLEQLDELVAGAVQWVTPVAPQPSSSGPNGEIEVNEAVDDPHRLARVYRNEQCTHTNGLTLRFYKDEYLRWDESAYRPVPTKEVNAQLSQSCKAAFDQANLAAIKVWQDRGERDADGKQCAAPVAKKVGTRLIGDVNQALTSMTLLKSSIEPPSWLAGDAPFDPREIIPCKNALVHLPSLTSGKPAIIPPTPRFFGMYALSYDFNPNAPRPALWLDFLKSLWGEDPDSISTLQEWFGYCLTEDTRQQKILEVIGPKRAGKDTIARILRALIAPENVAGPTLSSLATNFGLWPLIGKPLAVISDARLSGRSDIAVIVERLLTISGEGTLTIDRKNMQPWTGKLPTRLVLISNELPRLSDSSGALVGRLVLLRLTKSFYGKEDRGLFDRLVTELPGILLWAIEGWRRLNDRGHFLQPKTGRDMIEQMEDLSSPVGAFIRDRCDVGAGFEIPAKDLFEAWKQWCELGGRSRKQSGDIQSFGRDLGAALPQIRISETRRKNSDGNELRARVYVGIQVKSSF
jgi:putative DNA primase/helicase